MESRSLYAGMFEYPGSTERRVEWGPSYEDNVNTILINCNNCPLYSVRNLKVEINRTARFSSNGCHSLANTVLNSMEHPIFAGPPLS